MINTPKKFSISKVTGKTIVQEYERSYVIACLENILERVSMNPEKATVLMEALEKEGLTLANFSFLKEIGYYEK